MKYAIVIPDGAADEAVAELDRQTPLQAAQLPNIDWLSVNGRCGMVSLTPGRGPFAMETAIGSMLGCDPAEHALAAGPLEAAGLELPTDPADWVFRCSLVTIIDGVLIDPLGGGITTGEATQLIDELNEAMDSAEVRFLCGQDSRHLMITRQAIKVRTVAPCSVVGQPVANTAPRGRESRWVNDILQAAHDLLADHEINAVRRDLGESPVTDIWLWGPGQAQQLPAFEDNFGIAGAIIAADPLVRGLATRTGWRLAHAPCAPGCADADTVDIGQAAVALLDEFDLVCVHASSPDRAGLAGDPAGKVAAIEAIDRDIVGPILRRLRDEGDAWRMLIAPTHATPCASRRRVADPVPFALGGLGVEALIHQPYCEETAASADMHIRRGHELMEYFLTVR